MAIAVRSLLTLVFLFATPGCAGPVRELHPLSGDAFTLFPPERREPPAITCSGKFDSRFECFAAEMAERAGSAEVSGALVLLTPDGRRWLTVAPPDAELPVVDATRFPLASGTKMFIGATVASLADDGLLDLDQPVSKYLSELRSDVGPGRATLHQLLTHTAGMPIDSQCESGDEDIDDVVAALRDRKLWAPPGAVFNYSNLGYTLAAAVIERITGEPFEEVVKQRVLVPAGIPDATFDPEAVTVPGHPREGVPVPMRCRAMRPSGGLALTTAELSHWLAAVSQPETSPLGAHVVQTITAHYVTTGARPGETYGYGVTQFTIGGEAIYSHAGLLPGYSSFLAWAPSRRVASGAFANVFGSMPASAVARGISTFLGLPVDWNGPAGPAHALASYAGTYRDNAGGLGRIRVSVEEGDHLVVDYIDGVPPLLSANFRFFFDAGSKNARYVATDVGVGERERAPR